MTRIYFVRHCESEGNRLKVIQGMSDFDISESGAEQLKKLAERFDKIKLDAVYASPLVRAYKTAEAVNFNKPLEIIKDPDLREMHFGELEGKGHDYFITTFADEYAVFRNDFGSYAAPGGESVREVYERSFKAFMKIYGQNKGKTFAIVSHGGFLRVLFAKLIYNDYSMVSKMEFLANTAVTELVIDDDFNVTTVQMNDTSHLEDGLVTAFRV